MEQEALHTCGNAIVRCNGVTRRLSKSLHPPGLDGELRERLTTAAVHIARRLNYRGLGTFEFLVASATSNLAGRYAFIEANPRLQVEHTVTEEVLGLDLVQLQLEVAAGKSLAELNLDQAAVPAPRGYAIQARLNAEQISASGEVRPSTGTLTEFLPPAGPGVRFDTFVYPGYAVTPYFDSLLGKLIVHSPSASFADAVLRTQRALRELRVSGVRTNRPFLQNLVELPEFRLNSIDTAFVDANAAILAAPREDADAVANVASGHRAGARVDSTDPLSVLEFGRRARSNAPAVPRTSEPEDGAALAPMQGTVVSIAVMVGDGVHAGQELLVLNAMKMEHVVRAAIAGVVSRIDVMVGDTVLADQPLIVLSASDVSHDAGQATEQAADPLSRKDLSDVLARHLRALDEDRPETVQARHESGHRTARENLAALCDPGTFVEYGPLVLAAQRARRSLEELILKTPADGMITGIGSVNGDLFSAPANRCAIMFYDYMVLAGTQGGRNHAKTDRLLDVAERGRMPIVLFAEGGGGRAGDTDGTPGGAGGTRTFAHFARLSGLVPMVGITTGRCFAGNASLLGCCHVVIATDGANIGMGGPAMVEGGGLGVFAPEEIGPMDVQVPNGVVDIAVSDEAEAIRVARQYLSYFQGRTAQWEAPDQERMRLVVPENRLRVYDVREAITTLADVGTVLEIRRHFGLGMVTAFIRVEGRPVGVVANNPMHLGGAIDSDGADKAARFMQLCDGFGIPLLFLCDTPGIMVGPEVEHTALVRHSSRMFVIGANVTVPAMTIVMRKAYGLGAIAMASGSFKAPYFTVSWPTGEFGGMGLEGQVKLGYRNELAAITDPEARRRRFDEMVAAAYERGKALNEAAIFGVDDTIDPADSRRWVAGLLESVRTNGVLTGHRPWIDTW